MAIPFYLYPLETWFMAQKTALVKSFPMVYFVCIVAPPYMVWPKWADHTCTGVDDRSQAISFQSELTMA